MPDPVNPPAPPAGTPPASSTPPGTTVGAPWRAPATAGKFAGKTAEEVLGIAEALADMVQAGGAPAAPAAPAAPSFNDDDYLTGAQVKQLLATRQPDTSGVELAASANVSIVRSQYAALFAKYGPEIDAMIARVPQNLRTIDNLAQCVKLVRSDHLDEIVAEESTRRASEMAPTFRSTGSGAPPAPASREYSLESDKIDPEWKKRALANGVTESTVAEFCRGNDMTPEAFYKQFDTPFNRIVEDVSTRRPQATG